MGAEWRRGIGRLGRSPAPRGAWPSGRRAALSISFDDAHPSQLDAAVPTLDRLGVAGTFFVLPDRVAARPARWREAIETGHEVGNHTLSHPCTANVEWSRADALEDITIAELRTEIDSANRRIHELLGVEPRVFAYPCGLTFIGRGRETVSTVPLIAERFDAGRTFNQLWANAPLRCDLAQLAAVNSDEKTFAQLLPLLESTVRDGAWLVLGGHEFGELGPPDTTSEATINQIVSWCRDQDVWTATIGAVAAHVASLTRPSGYSRTRAGRWFRA